jgi:acyl phosphate:glycerol-3-phosphate acyltransferase
MLHSINIDILLILLLAYLIGSLPMGVILSKLLGLQDPRKVGSGNIGATNMVRAAGKKWGVVTLLLDALKGVAAVLLCTELAELHETNEAYLFGLIAVIGHCYPVWLKFKGGKGVATALAVIATAHLGFITNGWWIVPILTGCWIVMFYGTHIVSLASLFTFSITPVFTILMYGIWIIPLLLTLLIFIRHHENIKRLVHGKEHGFSTK